MFDTKIAIVVRDDLPVWQKLNVTAFLMSGIVGAAPGIIGERYKDAAGNLYSRRCTSDLVVMTQSRQWRTTLWRGSTKILNSVVPRRIAVKTASSARSNF
jgi:hypothetical protein